MSTVVCQSAPQLGEQI